MSGLSFGVKSQDFLSTIYWSGYDGRNAICRKIGLFHFVTFCNKVGLSGKCDKRASFILFGCNHSGGPQHGCLGKVTAYHDCI